MADEKRDIVDQLEDLRTITSDLADEYIKQVATDARDIITDMRAKFASRTSSVAAGQVTPRPVSATGDAERDVWMRNVDARLNALEKEANPFDA